MMDLNSDPYSALVGAVMYAISCYIRPRYNGIWLYYTPKYNDIIISKYGLTPRAGRLSRTHDILLFNILDSYYGTLSNDIITT